jgi:hypothetical protein
VAVPQTDVYAALAAVAAITTALQAAVALPPLTDSVEISRRVRESQQGTPARTNARNDAGRSALRGVMLNVPAAGVNGAVLAAWSTVAWVGETPWSYYVPWLAVTSAAAFLLTAAGLGVWNLSRLSG